jgi:hypothetical protein
MGYVSALCKRRQFITDSGFDVELHAVHATLF